MKQRITHSGIWWMGTILLLLVLLASTSFAAFVTRAKWEMRGNCGHKDNWAVAAIEDAGGGKKNGKPAIKVKTAFGIELTLTYRDKAQPGKKVEVADTATRKGKRFAIGSELTFEPMDAPAAIEFPNGTRWQPEFGLLKTTIVLDAKPAENSWEFDLELPKGADLYYQAELTQEEIRRGCQRPAWVVGSYAVYDETACKLAHIPRSFAKGTDGKWTWCDFTWKNGRLTVTVPQKFLDEAVYPVVIDPNLGYDTAGGSSSPGAGNNSIQAMGPWFPVSNGIITSVKWYLHQDEFWNEDRVTMGVYLNNAGVPDSLVDDTVEGNPVRSGTPTWLECTANGGGNVVTTSSYHIGISFYVPSVHPVYHYYDAYGGMTVRDKSPVTYVAGTMPATFGTATNTYSGYVNSAYAIYTEAAGGPSISVIEHHRKQQEQ